MDTMKVQRKWDNKCQNKKGQICLNDDTKRSKEEEEREEEKKQQKNTKSPIEINK